jgi:uncharacterized protein (DUF1501 family)
MQRRDFLQLAAACGLGVVAPAARAIPTKDSIFRPSSLYDGPFFVLVNASGGWDPTSLCDPKGALDEELGDDGNPRPDTNPMNRSYRARDIARAGNLAYAPVGGNRAFFEKYAAELLVLNGVDTSTNGHDSGSRHVWSGKLAEGYPSFGALVAAARSKTSPMAFLSNGGYDFTAGLVAPTRSASTGPLQRLAFPNLENPANAASGFHSADAEERIRAAQRARLNRERQKESLPTVQQAYGLLFAARSGESEVRNLTTHLPTQLDGSNNPLRRQAQLALAAYKGGLCVAANLSTGGFDTHGNHDGQHIPALQRITEGVDFLMEEAARQGVRDKVIVMVGSDFGRTPGYNDGNGKDHWPITSVLLMGAGIRGNRVVGASDGRHNALTINPSTLELDPAGIKLRPEHIHKALRRLAGLEQDALQQQFPLATDDLALL